MKIYKIILLLFFTLFFSYSQESKEKPDSIYIEEHYNEIIEKKAKTAAKLSLLLPGAGQFYNKSYWKIPVIYGILGALGYFVYINNREYNKWKAYYIAKIDGDTTTIDLFPNVPAEVLRSQRDYFRRNRDLFILLFSFSYILNGIEAYVDAHLKEFDVSENLSMKIVPGINSISLLITIK